MGLDARLWAERDGHKVVIHYWRKNYDIDDWFAGHMSIWNRLLYSLTYQTGRRVEFTEWMIDALQEDGHTLADELRFNWAVLVHSRWALHDGFKLYYCADW